MTGERVLEDPATAGFPLLGRGGAYFGRTATGRGSATVAIFPEKDGRTATVEILAGNGKASTKEPIPNGSAWQFVASHLAMFDMPTSRMAWRAYPTYGGPRKPKRKQRTGPGRVYFIADEQGFIKIGYSASLESRFAALKTSSRQRLTLLGSVPGDRKLEANLHRRFANLRRQGEWFAADDELRGFIDEQVSA